MTEKTVTQRKGSVPRQKAKAAAAKTDSEGAENSLMRMLQLLDLFTPAAPYWSADDLVRFSGASRATIYRHVRALHMAGFIRPVANGNYMIGPRVIELDRQLRQTDPLYIAGDQLMRGLANESGLSVILCALFSDSVMCVREELGENSPPNLFSRGQRRPLFTGASSKIMLPYLPPHQMRGVFAKHKKAIALAGLGSDWASFRQGLAQIRRAGYIVTVGEFNPGVLGISAPVFNRSGQILGSLGIAGMATDITKSRIPPLVEKVVATAAAMTERISALDSDLDFSPRAIG